MNCSGIQISFEPADGFVTCWAALFSIFGQILE